MRKILIILLCSTTVLLAGYVGLRAYSSWKQTHFLSLARRFAAQGDLRNAFLSAQQVIHDSPRNIEAWRFLADVAETNRAPETVLWRSRVLELAPDSAEDRLALVRAALAQGDLLTATNALAGTHDAATNTANYHILAGFAAVAMRQIPQAEAHFVQVSQLQPTNPVAQLNLAVLRLNQTNASAQSEARTALQQLADDPTLRSQAFRELIGDAVRHGRTNDALALSGKLARSTNASFEDRILDLSVLQAMRKEEVTSTLAACQRAAANDPTKIYQLAVWQAAAQGPQKTLFWLESLPSQMQSNRTVQLMQSECRVDSQDWRGLQFALPRQNWAEMDFVRHAFLARALRGVDLKSASDTEWPIALNATDYRKESLLMLLRLADAWNWRDETEELLWIFVNRYPEEKWAYTTLQAGFYTSGRTRSLMSLYERQAKRDPSDVEAKNNLAMTALLLDAVEIKPYELAREIYEQHATNAAFVSTYAFSLHLQKKDSEALRVMRQLKADDLNKPAVGAYYGLFLQAAGSNILAQTYLDGADKAVLLPEERRLFAEAKERIGHASASSN